MTKVHRITIEGNSIVDDHDRRTIAKFDLYNGSREELQAIADRANASQADAPAIQPQRMREALESARDHIASVNFYAAGTSAYIKTCEQLIKIEAALAHTRPECSPTENKGE